MPEQHRALTEAEIEREQRRVAILYGLDDNAADLGAFEAVKRAMDAGVLDADVRKKFLNRGSVFPPPCKEELGPCPTPGRCHDDGCYGRSSLGAQPEVSELREGDKQSNPKQSAGDMKLPIHLVPHAAVAAESLVFLVGASKYGRNNWREAGVLASTYFAAAMRHLMAWMEGEELDAETGTSHLASVRACCGIIIDAQVYGKLIDDRNYTPAGTEGEFAQYMGKLAAEVPRIRKEFSDRTPKQFDRRLHDRRLP